MRDRALLQRAAAESEYSGNIGLNRWAAGAINVAMWNTWGKCLEQPVWKMLGSYRDKAGLWQQRMAELFDRGVSR